MFKGRAHTATPAKHYAPRARTGLRAAAQAPARIGNAFYVGTTVASCTKIMYWVVNSGPESVSQVTAQVEHEAKDTVIEYGYWVGTVNSGPESGNPIGL